MLYYIPPTLFQPIYLIIILILTTLALRDVKRPPHVREKSGISLLVCLFFIWFIGNRPVHIVFCDMMVYAIEYVFVHRYWEGFSFDRNNIIFDNLIRYMAGGMHAHYTTFFQLMSVLFFLPMYSACKKFIPNHTLLSYLAFLGAFVTFSMATNGFKGGVATSIFALALAYRYRNPVLMVLLAAISIGFHHSMQLMIASLILTFFIKNPKYYFYGWGISLVLCVLHVSYFQDLFAGITDEQGAGYLNATGETVSGFRPDFVLYSMAPIVMGYYMKFKCKWEDKNYDLLLSVYLASNALWILCMYSAFTNRIASLSWSLYSLVLLYPCFRMEDQGNFVVKNRNLIIMAHLGFSLFMHFIMSR